MPYKAQNDMLIEALKEPKLIRKTVKTAFEASEAFNREMEEIGSKERLHYFEKITKENAPTDEDIAFDRTIEDDEDQSVPVKDEKEVNDEKEKEEVKEKRDEVPKQEEENQDFIGDMREEIMGGEIYTVDEIFKKLGIEKTSEYSTYSEYERNLLKEFRIDREMPENIAKKADYYKPVIERGLKVDERFFVRKINDKKGYGLFAAVDILPEDVIGVYTGIIQATDAEKGKKYEWYYSTIPDREKEKMVELRVNAKYEGSALRFVNHSKYYNCRLEYVPYNNQWYILFVSNRFINQGEEITVNYREKQKRMPSKIVDKWDKVEEEELQQLYEEYKKLMEEAQNKEQASQEKKEEASQDSQEQKVVKEEL